ncbi:MAG: hypothetical protein A4E49_01323 [Methanosaeta sp. PtaU1.Bin112]|nr:MAG: hypothetical protein A4E49_01323 [Methanosaeta sp. PtaU1.Bin112]
MPLIDVHLSISGLDSAALEQAGIIANFFAGVLLASEYFLINDKINKINSYLESHLSNAYSRLSKRIKTFAKWNRRLIAVVLLLVVSISVYQEIFYSSSSLRDYIIYYFEFVKIILQPLRRTLLSSLGILAVMFIILYLARSTPKKMIGAFAILLFTFGNLLLFLSTLVR